MGFLEKLFGNSGRPKETAVWQPPQEGSTAPPGFRPEEWEIPPEEPGGSDTIMTRGEADGSHTTVRLQESSVRGGGENKG